MDWFRPLGIMVGFAIAACSQSRPNYSAAAMPPPNIAYANTGTTRGAEPERPTAKESAPKKDPLVRTKYVTDPSLRAAVEQVGELPQVKGRVAASIMARVNGQAILFEEVYNSATFKLLQLQARVPESQWPALQEQVMRQELEDVINQELILQEIQSKFKGPTLDKLKEVAGKEFDSELRKLKAELKIKSDDELKAKIESGGQTLDDIRRQKERAFMALEYVRSRVKNKIDEIGREDLLEYYRKNVKEFDKPERVIWQHIYIDVDKFETAEAGRAHAESVLAEVKAIAKAEDFGPLAEKYSNGPSQYRKGEGEGRERGQIRPEDVEDAIFKLKPGETGEIIEVKRGFHIVRVVDHQPAGKVPFDKACADIRKRLQSQIGQNEYMTILKELRSTAYIEQAFAK